MKRLLCIGMVLFLTVAPTPASANYIFPVTEASDARRVSVAVRLLPNISDLGRQLDFFVYARMGGQIWGLGEAGWREVGDLAALPATRRLTLTADQTVPLIRDLDATALAGAALFAGYGASARDMLTQGNHQLVFTASASGADDPLSVHQWHLANTGQHAFARAPGIAGEDARIAPVHAQGVRGRGVIVAVPDDGLELRHIDLAANIVPGGSKNFIDGSNDPTPRNFSDAHGTAVAGIIAAVGWNNVGGRGVAPEARLKGFNLLVKQTEANFAESLGGSELADDVAVFNQSFGVPGLAFSHPDTASRRVYRAGVEQLRGGKGAIFVKSAGNDFESLAADDAPTWACAAANQAGTSCGSAQIDPVNSLIENFVIGAFNAQGKRSSYSSTGANLLLSAPAGEYGNADPALVTSDLSGCVLGYAREGLPKTATAFSRGEDTLNNPRCDFTHRMNGTSAAAAVTSGVVALMLSANPELGWRDVRDILIRTARPIDAGQPGVDVDLGDRFFGEGGQGKATGELPWTTNAAGLSFHNWYGFGAIDAQAAVAEAQRRTIPLPTFREGGWVDSDYRLDLAIPDFDARGIDHRIHVAENLVIESVQVELQITHDMPVDLSVELISPAGTRSLLINPFTGLTQPNIDGLLASNAFYGESCAGTWKLVVRDLWQRNAGTLDGWSLRCLGH